MKEYTIYEHISPNGKIYIGITSNPVNVRWGIEGINYLHKENGKYKHPLFANAILKYGWNNFQHNIIATKLGEGTAKNMEKDLIAFNKAKGISYNLADGGDGHLGYKMSEERKLQQSIERTGKILEGEWRQHVIDALQRNRQSIAKKHRKKVVQFDLEGNLISTFESVKHAQEETGVDASFIVGCCRGKYRTAKNYIWLYLDDYNRDRESLIYQHQQMPTQGSYKRDEQWRQAFSDRMKNCKVPYEQLISANKIAQKVLSKPIAKLNDQGDIITLFESASKAARVMNGDSSFISKACKLGRKAYGYYWKYIDKLQFDTLIQRTTDFDNGFRNLGDREYIKQH